MSRDNDFHVHRHVASKRRCLRTATRRHSYSANHVRRAEEQARELTAEIERAIRQYSEVARVGRVEVKWWWLVVLATVCSVAFWLGRRS